MAARREGRSRLTLVLLVLASITLLTVDGRSPAGGAVDGVRGAARTVFSPFAGAADRVASPVTDAWNGVIDYDDLERENDALRARIAELEGNQLRAVEAERERRELLALLGLEFVGDIDTVTARVRAGSPDNFSSTVEIDAGTNAGIAVGMPVVTGSGLVGKVAQAGRSSAIVMLLSDPQLEVGVRLAGSGDIGVASGRGPSADLEVDFVDARTEVAEGDLVTTSGVTTSLFPEGIPVGVVTSTSLSIGRDRLAVRVDPVATLDDLGFVQVLLWEPVSIDEIAEP